LPNPNVLTRRPHRPTEQAKSSSREGPSEKHVAQPEPGAFSLDSTTDLLGGKSAASVGLEEYFDIFIFWTAEVSLPHEGFPSKLDADTPKSSESIIVSVYIDKNPGSGQDRPANTSSIPTEPSTLHFRELKKDTLSNYTKGVGAHQMNDNNSDEDIREREEINEKVFNPDSLNDLADAYKREGDIKHEIDVRTTILERILSVSACNLLADAYRRQGDIETEIIGWMRMVKQYPSDLNLHNYLEDSFKRSGNIDAEIPEWERLLLTVPSSACHLVIKLTGAYARKNNIDREIDGWNWLLDNHVPSAFRVADKLGSAYQRKGDPDFEIVGWQKRVKMDPRDPDMRRKLEDALKRRDSKDGSQVGIGSTNFALHSFKRIKELVISPPMNQF
jgi:tetratricopeptide (TPR) repeat protein